MHVDGDGEGPPDFVEARDHVIETVLTFERALRSAGASVPATAGIDATRALVAVGFDDRERVRAALRAVFVSRQEDLVEFERIFPTFWRRFATRLGTHEDRDDGIQDALDRFGIPSADPDPAGDDPPELAAGDEGDGFDVAARDEVVTFSAEGQAAPDEEGESTAVYSPSGGSEPVSMGRALLRDTEALDDVMRSLTIALAELPGRRWGADGDDRVDVRRALRGSVGTGGTVVSLPTHAKKRSAVSATLLVDVSQSVLDTIDRSFLLDFLRRATRGWRTARVFFFDTDIQEVTGAFEASTPSGAVDALERAEAAWGGGTRIGHAVEAVRRHHHDAVDWNTTAIVISDGLEVGEIDQLEAGMSWLSRRAAAVLWCNPLAASPEYEPTCRGMAAALPYLDGLFAFTGPADVAEMARQLRSRGTGGPIGYEYDGRGRA